MVQTKLYEIGGTDMIVDNRSKGESGELRLDCVKLDGKDSNGVVELVLSEDTKIVAYDKACIETLNAETLVIKANEKHNLYLEGAPLNPCIGTTTERIGMSYGRWTPAGPSSLKKIILENVVVHFKLKVNNFSLGSYNHPEVPEFEFRGESAVINCPEMMGERILLKKVHAPAGSTKYSAVPEYQIAKPGQDLFPEQQELVDKLLLINPKMVEYINKYTNPRTAKFAVELLDINPELDISKMLQESQNIRHISHALCCLVLGMPFEWSKFEEFFLESQKYDFLFEQFPDIGKDLESFERIRRICWHRFDYRSFNELTPWEKRVVYESIPAYEFSFSDKSIEECAEEFYSEIPNDVKPSGFAAIREKMR